MENLRVTSERYLEKTLGNPKRAGTQYTLIDPHDTEHPVVGSVGDISLIVDPATGEVIQGRSITTTCIIKTLPVQPCRGWRAQLPGLDGKVQELFIQGVSPDHTIGLYYFTMGVNLEESAA
jgi:hypothetical protein